MPTYRVTIEEDFEDTIEELWRSYRTATQYRVVEIEAEDEEEAEDLAMDGEGTIISEDWDYGDSCDSEFYDTGDTIDSHHVDTRVGQTVTLEQASRQAEEARRTYEEMIAQSRAQYRTWMERKVYGDAPRIEDPPSWKL
jgi:hypothetical protein